jgi:hypothetical protein
MMEYLLPALIFAMLVAVIIGYRLKQRLSGASGLGRSDPQRLARLLVTEIMLYNGKALKEARQQAAIYWRLREEIERARRMYEEEIPAEERAAHFEDALVEILAEGEASALGPR